MARKRMISPEIWESSSFSKLSDFAKLIFIGLISNADDEGKGKANPGYIRSKLFPNDEERRVTDIKKALSEIALTMSIKLYEVNGDSLYLLTNWARWQKIDRPTPSKFPDPPKEKPMGERGDSMQNQDFDEGSANTRRILDEGSPLIEKNRIEQKRIEELNKNNNTQCARAREVKLITALGEFQDKAKSEALWKSILDKLEAEVNSLGLDVWIRPLVPIGFYNNALMLRAPSEAAIAEIETRYMPLILKHLSEENK